MNKNHGPAFYAQMISLDNCRTCRGRAVMKQIFHELPCDGCNGSGWVNGETGEALPLEVLATQLGLRYRESLRENKHQRWEIAELKGESKPLAAESRYYEQNNRRGAGGSNFTGD
jgi:hypothetical protein